MYRFVQKVFFIGIIVCAAALRFVQLGHIPPGLTNDEANVGYDAYSILKTGKDQWGAVQPSTSLKGFGDFRPPLYTYAVIPSLAVFGLSEFAVRFPSFLAGVGTVILVFFLAQLLFGNMWISFGAMVLLALNPWHIAMSRVGIESTLGVLLVVIAIICFLLGRKNATWYIPGSIFFGLTIYAYTAYILFTPLILLLWVLLYKKELAQHKKWVVIAVSIFIFCLLPLFFSGKFDTASARSSQVNFTQDIGIINVVNDKRGSCQDIYHPIICKITQNKYGAFVRVFLTNYVNHFSPEYLVVRGSPNQYSVLPEQGLLYIAEYVFVIIGVFFLLIQRKSTQYLLLGWLALSPIADSMTGSGHYSRYFLVTPVFQIIAAYGLLSFISRLKTKAYFLMPVIFYFVLELSTGIINYFSYFPIFYAPFSHFGYRDTVAYIEKEKNNFDRIYISNRVNDTKQYIFYLFYTAYDPAKYQQSTEVEKVVEQHGWIRVARIGNIYFRSTAEVTSDEINKTQANILVAGAPSEFPKLIKYKTVIRDKQRNPLFYFVSVAENADEFSIPYEFQN